MVLLSRLRDVLVTIVMSVPGPLILEVLFMVSRRVILPGCRLGLGHLGSILPQEFIDQQLLLDCVDVHIGDGRKVGLDWLGSRGPSPVGLDAFHVPLVDHSDDILGLEFVKVPEDSDVSHIDKDLLLLRRALVQKSNQEVDPAPVHGLSKGLSASHVEHISEILRLAGPS